jgi:hypothetical protein
MLMRMGTQVVRQLLPAGHLSRPRPHQRFARDTPTRYFRPLLLIRSAHVALIPFALGAEILQNVAVRDQLHCEFHRDRPR